MTILEAGTDLLSTGASNAKTITRVDNLPTMSFKVLSFHPLRWARLRNLASAFVPFSLYLPYLQFAVVVLAYLRKILTMT